MRSVGSTQWPLRFCWYELSDRCEHGPTLLAGVDQQQVALLGDEQLLFNVSQRDIVYRCSNACTFLVGPQVQQVATLGVLRAFTDVGAWVSVIFQWLATGTRISSQNELDLLGRQPERIEEWPEFIGAGATGRIP